VYPPVDTDFFRPAAAPPEPYALVVSALVPYKRLEIAMEACSRIRLALKIAGNGPDRGRLERQAPSGVEFLGQVSGERLRQLYQRASVILLPGEEDFGIVPLEGQACGRPVVALAKGGAVETVLDGETGVLVGALDPEAFADGINTALSTRFDREQIRGHAERFGRARFGDQMEALVREECARIAGPASQRSATSRASNDGAQGRDGWHQVAVAPTSTSAADLGPATDGRRK
jgi:glycosyltransferase involved in cell wall biosynthesis